MAAARLITKSVFDSTSKTIASCAAIRAGGIVMPDAPSSLAKRQIPVEKINPKFSKRVSVTSRDASAKLFMSRQSARSSMTVLVSNRCTKNILSYLTPGIPKNVWIFLIHSTRNQQAGNRLCSLRLYCHYVSDTFGGNGIYMYRKVRRFGGVSRMHTRGGY